MQNYWSTILHWNYINQEHYDFYGAQEHYHNYNNNHNNINNNQHTLNHYEASLYMEQITANVPQAHFAYDEVRDYHDPWEDYYRQMDKDTDTATDTGGERGNNEADNWQQTVDNELDNKKTMPRAEIGNETCTYIDRDTETETHKNKSKFRQNEEYEYKIVNAINSCEIVENQPEELNNSNIIEITISARDVDEQQPQYHQVNHLQHIVDEQSVQVVEANEHYTTAAAVHHCPETTNCNSSTHIACTTTTTRASEAKTTSSDETIERDINKDTHIPTNNTAQEIAEEDKQGTVVMVQEVKWNFILVPAYSGNILHFIISLFVCVRVCYLYFFIEMSNVATGQTPQPQLASNSIKFSITLLKL